MTKLAHEVRSQIAARMRGNTNARGKLMRRFAYRPSIFIGNKVAAALAAGNLMLEHDWTGSGRLGIRTNDPERAAAWVAKARKLGYAVRDAAPKPTIHDQPRRTKRQIRVERDPDVPFRYAGESEADFAARTRTPDPWEIDDVDPWEKDP